ncbi:MAG: prepilin peptidase [bacterium]|nr:prepilin peptidase [bacterium]
MLLIIFIFGCAIGSFLNCVIYRMESKKSFAKGRSFCPKCKHVLAWYDLIPIFSFLFLRGKCHYCKKKISWQYPAVEIATGILFAAIMNYELGIRNYEWWSSVFIFNSLFLILNSCFLILIFIYDLKHYIIPDKLVFPAIGIALFFNIFSGFFLNSLIAGLVASGFFFLIWLVSRGRWLGFGDVKLALLMGLLLSWPNILVALFFAFVLGATIGLILIAFQKKTMKSQVPFGPFLIIGTFIGLFWGQNIINWYLNLIL